MYFAIDFIDYTTFIQWHFQGYLRDISSWEKYELKEDNTQTLLIFC